MNLPTKPTIALFLLCLSLSFTSCNKEELFVELEQEIIEETDDTPVDENEDADEDTSVDTSLSCDFTLNTITANATVIINCALDLEGNTITLPANTNIVFEGGEIINGTLVFSGGTIDGDLLNISLEIDGDVTLNNASFNFYPEKWGIVEGKTTKEISLQNRKNINKTIDLVKRLGANVFEIGNIDAYFEIGVTGPNRKWCSENSIRVPSNFHLKMSNDTFLRVQPTHLPAYALITTYTTDNSVISGGNLIGDRWEHDYTPFTDTSGVNRREHGWGHLIWIIGSHGTIVDGVTANEAIGEGIQVHAETIRNPDGSLRPGKRTCENVLIKNCLFKESRRNGIAIIDADGVIIDNCDIVDTGKGAQAYDADGNKVYSSSGALPKYGIDLEALRYINDDGTMNEINKIENVIIRNNRLTGNDFGDIDLFTCSNVIIENNYFDSSVANIAADNIIIRNNTFEARELGTGNAVNIKSYVRGGIEFNYNYKVTGNTIKGYGNAILMGGKNQEISNNTIKDCNTAVSFRHDFSDSTFSNNTIESSLQYSYGYKSNGSNNVSNITISNESVNVDYRAINLIKLNNESTLNNIQITFDGCTFTNRDENFTMSVNESKNIEFKNNTTNTDFEIVDSENIILTNNTIAN